MTRTSKFDTRFNDSFTCVNLPYKYISACSWHMGGVGRYWAAGWVLVREAESTGDA